jgi:hypothetical protein
VTGDAQFARSATESAGDLLEDVNHGRHRRKQFAESEKTEDIRRMGRRESGHPSRLAREIVTRDALSEFTGSESRWSRICLVRTS